MTQMNPEAVAKLEAVAAILTTRVNKALDALMEECMKDVQASYPTMDFEEAASNVAGVVLATTLAQLRVGGCPDDVMKSLVIQAAVLERSIKLPPS